jgi:hypothetical protein
LAVSSFGKRIDGPAGRRRIPRRQVGVLGSAVTIDGSKSVIVEDICPGGARLVGRNLPDAGDEILLRTSELAVLGRIGWAKDDERGLVFEGAGAPSAGDCLALQMRANGKI